MLLTAKAVVTGATQFAGNIDGKDIAANTIFVEVEFDSKRGGFGYRTDAMRCENADVINRIKHNPFPFEAELQLEQIATKGKTSTVVTNIKPLDLATKKAPV